MESNNQKSIDTMPQILDSILPYSEIVGQSQLKLALELAYIAPCIGGVLISGQRGTAKSTTVRAFATMMYGKLPVTIPINATEDRVVGGWQIEKLLDGKPETQQGLIQAAHDSLLYIDEVNLLDGHIVNILLDVTSTGKLVIQREGRNEQYDVQLTLVGTMNPEEGNLRPQLQDRFGLMVNVASLLKLEERQQVLATVLAFDQALYRKQQGQSAPYLDAAQEETRQYKQLIEQAKELFPQVHVSSKALAACVRLADEFRVEGHRADYTLALAAQAHAARDERTTATTNDVAAIAELVLRHRTPESSQLEHSIWNEESDQRIAKIIEDVDTE
jgi:magnesium chelatase subunit I